MNLYVKLKLNRPVNKQVETVSLGSFAVIVKGVQLRFDFMDSSINISVESPVFKVCPLLLSWLSAI